MLKLTILLSILSFSTALGTLGSWFKGPLRWMGPESEFCRGLFAAATEYKVMHLETEIYMSYCEGCVVRKNTTRIPQSVVSKSEFDQNSHWIIKRLTTPGAIHIEMPGVGGLKILPKGGDDEVETALVFDKLKPTVWTYVDSPNLSGGCNVIFKSMEGDYYIRQSSPSETPDWTVTPGNYSGAIIATKVEPRDYSWNYMFTLRKYLP